jgi:hypothetical protein
MKNIPVNEKTYSLVKMVKQANHLKTTGNAVFFLLESYVKQQEAK